MSKIELEQALSQVEAEMRKAYQDGLLYRVIELNAAKVALLELLIAAYRTAV